MTSYPVLADWLGYTALITWWALLGQMWLMLGKVPEGVSQDWREEALTKMIPAIIGIPMPFLLAIAVVLAPFCDSNPWHSACQSIVT